MAACSDDVPIGYDLPAAGAAGSASAGTGGVAFGGAGGAGTAGSVNGGAAPQGGSDSAGQGGEADCEIRQCSGKTYDCGDCLDNDGDGLSDALDPQCLGVCDNTEDAYFGGIPGQNNAPCRQDCYFDADSGSGNDNCSWTHACDPLSLAPDYPPSGNAACAYDPNTQLQGDSCGELQAAQAPACFEVCLPLVPNGCDCFGCCELPARSGKFVFLGSQRDGEDSCGSTDLGDPLACRPCTPVPSCFNTCEPCESCVGGAAPAADCAGKPACASGLRSCAASSECDADAYCVTGCCIAVPR